MPPAVRVRALILRLVLTLAAAAGCADPPSNTEPSRPRLTLFAVEPSLVLPTTELRVDATGLTPDDATYTLILEGHLGDAPLLIELPAAVRGPRSLSVPLAGAIATNTDATLEARATLAGRLANGSESRSSLDVSLRVRPHLTPSIELAPSSQAHLGDTLVTRGSALLLPSEGLTLAHLSGTLTLPDGEVRPVPALVVPGFTVGEWAPGFQSAPVFSASARLDRRHLGLVLSPDLFGIRPATFSGELTLINLHNDGTELSSAPLACTIELRPPIVTGLSPSALSRGQYLVLSGRGFSEADDLLQTATLIALEGTFTPRRGAVETYAGDEALFLFPDDLDGSTAFITVLRVEWVDGRPVGLGSTPGRFVGRATPLVLSGPDLVAGDGLDVELHILPTRQVVQLRVLPGFSEALARFGLGVERKAILDRILEVAHRDYDGINITFTYDDPIDFAEYTIVELGGPDPNGSGLFGLDNTEGKDSGNRRLDDVIGGFNAGTRAGELMAYGGVFASEFMNLSPRLSDNPLASPRFDAIFGDLAPELGGRPAEPGESLDPAPRAAMIREAVRVLSNLIGTTITHEVGHALGLTALEGRHHNDGDTKNALMDAGVFRPFEERAELDGLGPAVLEPFNRLYLESVLPLDPASD